MIFSGSTQFLREHLFLFPAVTLFCATQILLSSLAVLALSSLSNSRRFVAIMYAGVVFFTEAMYRPLVRMTGSSTWTLISPGNTIDVIGDKVFRLTTPPAAPLAAAIAVIIGLAVASVIVLERRVRAVEVVS
jgi:hypothetical protein